MWALVNKIIPFSAVDGPGNRTAVFLQGCNFNCTYCHNPETRNICIGCGTCVTICNAKALSMTNGRVYYKKEKCCDCDNCIQVCPNGSSPKIREMTPEELFLEVKKQMPFIRGVTVSGGECTLYPQFLKEFFKICKENKLETMIDSNGSLDFKKVPQLLAVTDGVMLDIKAWEEKAHKRITGAANDCVLENARYLAQKGKLYEVRTVVVPELFQVEETVKRTAKMLAPFLKILDIRYKIIAYRPIGVRKEYAQYRTPDKEELEALAGWIQAEGFTNVIII